MTLFWAVHTARPLSSEELDIILTFESTRSHGMEPSLFPDYPSFLELHKILPEVFEITEGRLSACQLSSDEKTFLTEKVNQYFPHIKSSGVHIAETSLLFLLDYLLEGPFRAKVKGKGETLEETPCSYGTERKRITEGTLLSFAKYAAQCWILHYKSTDYRPTLDDEIFSQFVGESTVQGWIKLLVASSDWPELSYDDQKHNIFRIMNPHGLHRTNPFRVLEFCSFASSHSSSTGLLDRFLVLAAELGDRDFVLELCEAHGSEAFARAAVIRAIAVAPEALSKEFIWRLSIELEQRDIILIFLTTLHLSHMETAQDALKSLKSRVPPQTSDDLGTKAMLITCEYSDVQMTTMILNDNELSRLLSGDDSNSALEWSPLHVAATKGHVEILSRLFELGMEDRMITELGQSPLILAAAHGFGQLVTMLRGKSAAVGSRDSLGRTPLHHASRLGFLGIAQLLVSRGAGIMTPDYNHDTPLHLAIRHHHSDVAMFLLEHFLRELPTEDEDLAPKSPISDSDSEEGVDYHPIRTNVLDVTNSEGVTNLLEAVKQDLVDIARSLICKGKVNPSIGDQDSMTPLHYAAKNGSRDLISCLVEYSAAIKVKKYHALLTPMHLACYRGHSEAVQELLKTNHDLSTASKAGHNPFLVACIAGELRVVEALLPHYSEAHWTEGLVNAASCANNDIVEYLLESGCDPDAADGNNNTALKYAVHDANAKLTQPLLLRRCQLDPRDSNGRTPLHDAVTLKGYESLKLLTDAGANMELESNRGETPLSMAIFIADVRSVRLLLVKGAKLRLSSYWTTTCSTVLELALKYSSDEIACILIELYAQGKGEEELTPENAISLACREASSLLQPLLELWPDTVNSIEESDDEDLGSALHLLALKGDISQLKRHLEVSQDVSINRVSGKYGTALQAAICGNGAKVEKVQFLLSVGADPSIRGGCHGTAMNAAAYWQQNEIVRILAELLVGDRATNYKEYMAVVGGYGGPLAAAIKGSSRASSEETVLELLEILLENGASIFSVGPYGETLLHSASRTRFLKVVKWLLSRDISAADATDLVGRRPVHLAVHKGESDIVKLLLTKHTTLDTTDNQGRNTLHYAVISENRDMTETLVELYLQAKGTKDASDFVNSEDRDMWTPLHWACRQHYLDLVKFLIEQGADKLATTRDEWTPWHVAVFHGKVNESYIGLLPKPALYRRGGLPYEPAPRHEVICGICNCVS
ncbi:hypothetical protein MMC10_011302 [Thelotrema lepadinum]|nr:hypothetical protein [Thelotrema lepadinum]